MKSLYTVYRPSKWDEVIGQESVVKILKQQIETNHIFNCMIFAGTSGTGKTTLARIYANELNKGHGSPIEMDAASNSGVDNVRQITATAAERSLDSEYKVIIIDEAHNLSGKAWDAFLKCIEEPPYYTVFIFCTTDPHKIPPAIQNRCMRFNFTRVSQYLIEQRLNYICMTEGYKNYQEVTNYISRICEGEVRKGISYLETCVRYDENLSMENTLMALGNSSYEDYFTIINAILDGDSKKIIETVDRMYNDGIDLKKFVDLFTEFCFDVIKFILYRDIKVTKIPDSFQTTLEFTINIENSIRYLNYIVDKLLNLKNLIKQDNDERTTIGIVFNQISRFV